MITTRKLMLVKIDIAGSRLEKNGDTLSENLSHCAVQLQAFCF